MIALWLKAAHVTAMATWLAGMIIAPVVLAAQPGRATILALRRHFGRVTTPAMLLTLGLGLWLAQDAGWFRDAWLQAKLALVLFLTAVHGIVAGQLRRCAEVAGYVVPPWLPRVGYLVVGSLLVIAWLAIVKPALWAG